MANTSRAVITLATTKMIYVDMAFVLARSFVLWHRDAGIPFYIFTDLRFELPAELRDYVEVRRMPPGELGAGFSPKLHLDKLAPAPYTIFVDADCICVGPLDRIFDRFAGRCVSVVGERLTSGMWWGNVADIIKRIDRPAIYGFNGGLYYLESGELANAIYARARELEDVYDAWELVRLRKRPNDEILMSIAMAEAGLEAVEDDGTIMAPYNSFPKFIELDVFRGRCAMSNPPTGKYHNPLAPVRSVSPVLPHFVDSYTLHWRYRSEALKLRLHMAEGIPRWLAELIASLAVSVPGKVKSGAKDFLRPIYRALFGVRRVTPNERE